MLPVGEVRIGWQCSTKRCVLERAPQAVGLAPRCATPWPGRPEVNTTSWSPPDSLAAYIAASAQGEDLAIVEVVEQRHTHGRGHAATSPASEAR